MLLTSAMTWPECMEALHMVQIALNSKQITTEQGRDLYEYFADLCISERLTKANGAA